MRLKKRSAKICRITRICNQQHAQLLIRVYEAHQRGNGMPVLFQTEQKCMVKPGKIISVEIQTNESYFCS